LTKRLIVYDVDDTLFFANQRIGLTVDGVPTWMTPQEFHEYDVAGLVDHSVDYSLLLSSDNFVSCLKPNQICIEKLIYDIDRADSDIVIMTARGEVDDVPKFKSAFRDHGIDIDSVEFRFCSPDVTLSSHKKKEPHFRQMLAQHYDEVTVYDDNVLNLETVHHIALEYPATTVNSFRILPDGSISKYYGERK
jgi:hypothetical protein